VGVSALRYPSGQADSLDIGGQVSTSSATGIVVAEIHAEREQPPGPTTSRQPSATAAAALLPPEGPSYVWTTAVSQRSWLAAKNNLLQWNDGVADAISLNFRVE